MNEIIDVPMKGQRDLATVTAEIRAYQDAARRMAISYSIEIGRRLIEAKEMVEHGEWGDYIKTELGFSQTTANNHMAMFRAYAADQMRLDGDNLKNQAFGNLTYTQALALLALPSEEEREAFVETHDVASMSTRELREELRRRTEDPSSVTAEAVTPSPQGEDFGTGNAKDGSFGSGSADPQDDDGELYDTDGDPTGEIGMLEWQLEKARQEAKTVGERYDAAMEEIRAQNIRQSNLEDKLRSAEYKSQQAEKKAQEAADELGKLQKEVRDAKAREKNLKADLKNAKDNPTIPKETLDKLRAEAEEAAKKALEAENKTGELDAAKARYEAAEMEASKARQEAERLEKELRAAAPEIAEFKFLFGQAQETLSRCVEALPGLPPDKVPGCTKAIKRLLEGALERLEADKWEAAMPE